MKDTTPIYFWNLFLRSKGEKVKTKKTIKIGSTIFEKGTEIDELITVSKDISIQDMMGTTLNTSEEKKEIQYTHIHSFKW